MGTKITGHRGYPAVAPENTLPSFEAAIQAGAERIELDLHESRDGTLVVHHDYYLGRTNNGGGPLFQQNWSALAELDAGAWFAPEFRGLRLCRLEDVLDRFGHAAEYEIELKWPGERFLQAVVEAVRRRNLLGRVEFTSPHLTVFPALRRRCPEAFCGLFVSPYPDWMTREVGDRLAVGVGELGRFNIAHVPGTLLEPSFVEMFHAAGIALHAANCNDAAMLLWAFVSGADFLSTEVVSFAVELRASVRSGSTVL